ncbi:bacteriocin [Streptococcus sp. ZJ151]
MEEIKKFSKISDEELQNIEGGSILGATIRKDIAKRGK